MPRDLAWLCDPSPSDLLLLSRGLQRLGVGQHFPEAAILSQAIEVRVGIDEVHSEAGFQPGPQERDSLGFVLGMARRGQGVDATHLIQIRRAAIAAESL